MVVGLPESNNCRGESWGGGENVRESILREPGNVHDGHIPSKRSIGPQIVGRSINMISRKLVPYWDLRIAYAGSEVAHLSLNRCSVTSSVEYANVRTPGSLCKRKRWHPRRQKLGYSMILSKGSSFIKKIGTGKARKRFRATMCAGKSINSCLPLRTISNLADDCVCCPIDHVRSSFGGMD